MEIKRGDIVWVDLSGAVHSEQGNGLNGSARLCFILQSDIGNHFSPTTIIAPFTSKKKHHLPTHVDIHADRGLGIKKDSTLMLEQIRTVDKKRITGVVGHISDEEIIKQIMSAYMANFMGVAV